MKKEARKFLIDWFGLGNEEFEGDNDVDIAEYLLEYISNGDIDEILSIMKTFAKEQIKNNKENAD